VTNLAAFLATLRFSEGTAKAPDPYAVVYGFLYTITDFSDHPTTLGTWLGVQTPWGHTTAAGAYQIEVATWRSVKKMRTLPDFSPASQDAAATELIREAGAFDLVYSGCIAEAIAACKHIWASLPGSPAGQPTKAVSTLLGAYTMAGGAFA